MKPHHIGIVVTKISESVDEIKKFLPFEEIQPPEVIDSQKVKVIFLKMGEMFFELIEPMGEGSPVYEFSKKGGGIHHVCFEVDNIHQSIEDFKKKGARVVVEPVIGFEGRLISFLFLNMKKTNCNLIELAEKK